MDIYPLPSSPKSDLETLDNYQGFILSDLGEVPKAEGVTIKIDNESLNDLLPPKMDSQLIRRSSSHTLRSLLGGSHLAAKFFGVFKFFVTNFP